MDYSVKPSRNSFESVRGKLQALLESYSHSVNVETVEISLAWAGGDEMRVLDVSGGEILLDVESGVDEEAFLRALLELEYIEKAGEPVFRWQEAAKFAYAALRFQEVKGEPPRTEEEVIKRKSQIVQGLGDRLPGEEDFFFFNASLIGETVARGFESPGEILEAGKSDVEQAFEEVDG